MKKNLKVILLTLVVIVVVLLTAPHLTKNKTGMTAYMFDMFNPFVRTEEVYAKIPSKPSSSWKDAGNGKKDYGYVVKSYNKSGKERTVMVSAFGSKMDSSIVFVKITTKGQSVRQSEAISESDIPKIILKAMEEK